MVSLSHNQKSFSFNRNKPFFFNKKKSYYGKKTFSRKSFKKRFRRLILVPTRFFKFFLKRKNRRSFFRAPRKFSRTFFISTLNYPLFPSLGSLDNDVNFSLFSKQFLLEAETLQSTYSRRLSKRFLRAYIKVYRLGFFEPLIKAFFKRNFKKQALLSPAQRFVKSYFQPISKAVTFSYRPLSFLRRLALKKIAKKKKLKKFYNKKVFCRFFLGATVKKFISKREANKKIFLRILKNLSKKPSSAFHRFKSKALVINRRKVLVFRPKIQRLPSVFLRLNKPFKRLFFRQFKVNFPKKILRNRVLRSYLSKVKIKILKVVFGARFLKKCKKPLNVRKFFFLDRKRALAKRFLKQRPKVLASLNPKDSFSSRKHFFVNPPKLISSQKIPRGFVPSKKINGGVNSSKIFAQSHLSYASKAKGLTKPQLLASKKHFRKDFGMEPLKNVAEKVETNRSMFLTNPLKKDFRNWQRPTEPSSKQSWNGLKNRRPLVSLNYYRKGSLNRWSRTMPKNLAKVSGPFNQKSRSKVNFRGRRSSAHFSRYSSRSLFKSFRTPRFSSRRKRSKPRLLVSLLGLKPRLRFRPSSKKKKKSPLFLFLKKQLKMWRIKKTQRKLIFNRFSFDLHGASRQRIIWISSLFFKNHWAFKRLFLFFSKMKVLRRRVREGIALDFSGYGERFRWPSRIRSEKVIYPSYLWELVTSKAQGMSRYLRRLSYLTKFLRPSLTHQKMLFRLHLWYTKAWGLKLPVSLCGIASKPLFLHKVGSPRWLSVFFFVFWRPLWDTFDKNLLLEDYYSEWPCYDSIWPILIYKLLGYRRFFFSKALSSIFLFQFLDREFRFWSSVFNSLFLLKDFSLGSQPFLQKFTPLVANPLWYLHQLNRLLLVLPFLPKSFRFSFFNNYRIVSGLCWQKSKDQKDLVIDVAAKSLERMDYWFRHQTKYFKRQQKKSSRFVFFDRLLKMLRSTIFCRWLSHLSLPWKRQLRRQFKLMFSSKKFISVGKITIFPFSKLRLFFLRRKLSRRIKSRFLQRPPTLQLLTEYPQNILLKHTTLWRLLLLWSLFFSRRFHFQQKFFNLSQWLLYASSFLNLPSICRIFSLESLWSCFLNKTLLLENPFRAACFHWVLSKSSSQSFYHRHSFRKSFFHRFFFPLPRSESQPIPNFYKRYNYIRRLPFRYFRQFWPQSANFPRLTKFKTYRKPAISTLHQKFHLVQPLAYVSHTQRFYQQLVWSKAPMDPLKYSRQKL